MELLQVSSREFAGSLVPSTEADPSAAAAPLAENTVDFEHHLAEAARQPAPAEPAVIPAKILRSRSATEQAEERSPAVSDEEIVAPESEEPADQAQELPLRAKSSAESAPAPTREREGEEPQHARPARTDEQPPEGTTPQPHTSDQSKAAPIPPAAPHSAPPQPEQPAPAAEAASPTTPEAPQRPTGDVALNTAPPPEAAPQALQQNPRPAARNGLVDGAPAGGESTRPSNGSQLAAPQASQLTEAKSQGPSQDASSSASPSASAPAPQGQGATFLDLQPQAAPQSAGNAASPSNASPAPASPSPAGPPLPHTAELRQEPLGPQIVRGALAMTRTTGGAMTMRLEPESLGSLRIQMQMSQGRVAVQFHAQTAEARGLLSQHVQTLRQAMEAHGLKLETVQIHTLARSGSSASTSQEQSSSQSHSPGSGEQSSKHDAGGQQSRGHADTSERQAQYRQAARQFARQAQRQAAWSQQWTSASAAEPNHSPAPAS